MSWSVSFIGKPADVAKALDEYSETLNGQSREEYDAAKPHLIGLVQQNFSKPGTAYVNNAIRITANGSGSSSYSQGKKVEDVQRSCAVTIESHYANLV